MNNLLFFITTILSLINGNYLFYYSYLLMTQENTAIKQELDKKNAEIKEISEKAQTDAEEVAKKIAELEEKVKAFEENKETPSDNTFFIELLDQFDAKILLF